MNRPIDLPIKVQGQALLEFALSLTLICPMLWGTAGLLREQWIRMACSRAIFETTRARLEGRAAAPSRYRVLIEENPGSVTGSAYCLKQLESVELPRLEGGRP